MFERYSILPVFGFLAIAGPLAGLFWGLHEYCVKPNLSKQDQLTMFISVLCCGACACALTILIKLMANNLRQWRKLLSPDIETFAYAIVMAVATPLFIIQWKPLIAGSLFYSMSPVAPTTISISLFFLSLWLPLCGLIRQSTHSRVCRVFVLCLIWVGFYSAVLLAHGPHTYKI